MNTMDLAKKGCEESFLEAINEMKIFKPEPESELEKFVNESLKNFVNGKTK